ncbi:hypothetical protein [Neptunomonas concharum]|uniref:Uncharacterized protein n=1 Tax=Neptunomonas concharum TaxID=1031538 RepID=A0A5P1R9I5_9GAMM|nr:hypothetical protein [Neptunomonas concharum]QEQ96268.1 hypothetical protein F0U83_05850 [Neptunomonas concharum]
MFDNLKYVQQIFVALTKLFLFFRDPENQHLATWVQTLAVVAGVVIALNQLDTLTKQDQIKSNERYLEFEKRFSSDISLKIGALYEHYENRNRLNDDEYSKLYTLEGMLKIRREIEIYISDLSTCGNLQVCPKSLVDNNVCAQSKHLHHLLSKELKLPPKWKMSFNEPVFYEWKINEHCNIFERAYYWWST